MPVCIGIDGVEGVKGTGIDLGVMFSSSAAAKTVLEGVVNGVVLLGIVFWTVSVRFRFRSSNMFVAVFEDSLDDIGEKGLRTTGDDSTSWALNECFFAGRPAMSKPLLPK